MEVANVMRLAELAAISSAQLCLAFGSVLHGQCGLTE
jgi:hypothetical protein